MIRGVLSPVTPAEALQGRLQEVASLLGSSRRREEVREKEEEEEEDVLLLEEVEGSQQVSLVSGGPLALIGFGFNVSNGAPGSRRTQCV